MIATLWSFHSGGSGRQTIGISRGRGAGVLVGWGLQFKWNGQGMSQGEGDI